MGQFEISKNDRGFEIATIEDQYGVECSIQQSSAIGDYQDSLDRPGSSFLWIGPKKADPKCMASQAASLGVETTETTGWVPYPVPDSVLMKTRMHLNREQVQEIIRLLQRWLETGRLSSTPAEDPPAAGRRANTPH